MVTRKLELVAETVETPGATAGIEPATVATAGGQPDDWAAFCASHSPLAMITPKLDGNKVVLESEGFARGDAKEMEQAALGTVYPQYYAHTMTRLVELSMTGGEINPLQFNGFLGMVAGIRPRDQLESMLAVQMAAIHDATLRAAKTLQGSTQLKQFDSAQNALNKLARTFAAQVETLKRYRSKGEQRVYVERVNVESGGQAVVGNVEATGRGRGR